MKTQASKTSLVVILVAGRLARRRTALTLSVPLTMLALSLSTKAQTGKNVIVTFDPPGSVDTFALDINPEGNLAGYYLDAGNVFHGFLRDSSGSFTAIDAPSAGTGSGQGTKSESINSSGAIAGLYVDVNFMVHGYLRSRDGSFSSFDARVRVPACIKAPSLCASTLGATSQVPRSTTAA